MLKLRGLSKFRKDETGVMTIEFAVMLPVLFAWFAGLFLFFNAFHSWMKSWKATYTVSDMLSRQNVVDDAFIVAMDGIFDSISNSTDNGKSWIRVTSIGRDATGLRGILWSTHTNPAVQPELLYSDIATKVPILDNSQSVILLETFNPYTPVFDWELFSNVTFSNNIASPSRFTTRIVNSDHPGETFTSDEGIDPEDELGS